MLSSWIIWFILAGGLAVLELMTGTFYLLVFALGAAGAAAAAYAGMTMTAQILTAAFISLIGYFATKRLRPQRDKNMTPDADPNLNMDIGTTVRIDEIREGKITVKHRGTKWDALIEEGKIPMLNQDYVITKVRGAQLVLSEKK